MALVLRLFAGDLVVSALRLFEAGVGARVGALEQERFLA
jgi:hypothetical protein